MCEFQFEYREGIKAGTTKAATALHESRGEALGKAININLNHTQNNNSLYQFSCVISTPSEKSLEKSS